MKNNYLGNLQRDGQAVEGSKGNYTPKQKLSELSPADLIAFRNHFYFLYTETGLNENLFRLESIDQELSKRKQNIDWDN